MTNPTLHIALSLLKYHVDKAVKDGSVPKLDFSMPEWAAIASELAALAQQAEQVGGYTFDQWWAREQNTANTRAEGDDWLGLDESDKDQYRHCWEAAQQAEQKPVAVPQNIAAIIERLHAQDNRATANPIFAVRQKRRIYGIDTMRCDDIVWLNEAGDYREADAEETKRLEAGIDTDGWFRTGYIDTWRFVTACLTEQGCKDYLAANGHNLKDPEIYAYSAHRNAEFIGLREWLMSLSVAPAAPQPSTEPWPQCNPWAAAIDQALIERQLDCTTPDSDPIDKLWELIDWCVDMALDHRVSKAAQDLIDRGRAEANNADAQDAAIKACRSLVSVVDSDEWIAALRQAVEEARVAIALADAMKGGA